MQWYLEIDRYMNIGSAWFLQLCKAEGKGQITHESKYSVFTIP